MARQRNEYSDEYKREVVAAFLDEEENASSIEVAGRYGVSVASVHTWSRDPRYRPNPGPPRQPRPRPESRLPLVQRFAVLEAWCQQIGRELGIELEA